MPSLRNRFPIGRPGIIIYTFTRVLRPYRGNKALGDISLKVHHTPGHSAGAISLVIDKIVFVGDTLFAGSIGRADFPGCDYEGLIRGVHTKLFNLSDLVVVYPGHGPETTVGQEERSNPFFAEGGRWL